MFWQRLQKWLLEGRRTLIKEVIESFRSEGRGSSRVVLRMYFKASATQSRRRHSLLVCAGSLTGAISALHSLWPSFQHSCIGLHARSPGDLGPTQSAESFSHSYIVRSLTGAMWALHSLRRASRTPALYARSPGRFEPYTVCRRASRIPALYAHSPGRFGPYIVHLQTSFPHSCIGLHVEPGRFGPYTVCGRGSRAAVARGMHKQWGVPRVQLQRSGPDSGQRVNQCRGQWSAESPSSAERAETVRSAESARLALAACRDQ